MDKRPPAENVTLPNGDTVSQIFCGGETVVKVNWSALFRQLGEKMGLPVPPPAPEGR